MGLQQQVGIAKQEVLELSAKLKASGSASLTSLHKRLANSASFASLLNSSLNASAVGADAELRDLRQRCKVLEQKCASMHGMLATGQLACERWRRRGLSRPASTSSLCRVPEVLAITAPSP